MTDLLPIPDFLAYIKRGEIPPLPPVGTSPRGCDYDLSTGLGIERWTARDFCLKRGMFAIVDERWTKALAEWIGNRRVLEIMAGCRWLAKALAQHGINIVATDHFGPTWEMHQKAKPVWPVENLEASDAIRKYGEQADILLVSWPPYDNQDVFDAVKLWDKRPIIYIGEGAGGCTACDAFFQVLVEDEDAPGFSLFSWSGIHDSAMVGHIEMDRYDPEALEDDE